MTDQQVLRYTQLCKRRMDILLHSGASWLPEYEAELKSIDQRSLRKESELLEQKEKHLRQQRQNLQQSKND